MELWSSTQAADHFPDEAISERSRFFVEDIIGKEKD